MVRENGAGDILGARRDRSQQSGFVILSKIRLYNEMQYNSSDTTQKHPPLSLPFYYGWLGVSLCFLTTLASAGDRSSPSVPFAPLDADVEECVPRVASASLLGIMGALNIVGTTFSGWMVDRVQAQKWLALVYALRGVALLILPSVHNFSGLAGFAGDYSFACLSGGAIGMVAAGLALQIKVQPKVTAPPAGAQTAGA